MKIKHKDYLTFKIPNKWIIEENDEDTVIYDNNGEGAIVLSFYTLMELQNDLEEHISMMAKNFIDGNMINLDNPLNLEWTKKEKVILNGTGKTSDNDFIKIWIIAKYPKVIIATYEVENQTAELKQVDKIIDSFCFCGKF